MIPVVLKFKEAADFKVKVCVTGQHRQMLDQVLDLFNIRPDYDLDVMRPNQTLNGICTAVIAGMDRVLSNEHFDYVFVHGDTTTTMSVGVAAFQMKIPVCHVEAGLRTYNMYSPWPEEMNRRVVGLLSSLHFAPTETSKENLLRENVNPQSVFVTGNTVIDALRLVVNKIESDVEIKVKLEKDFSFIDNTKKMILVTGHRRENFGSQFENICLGLKRLAENPLVQIVYPVHLNPNVQEPVKRILGNLPNIFLLAPQEYLPFVYLMTRSYLIVTDSGGVQEEAPALDKPVLVMRDTTERPEAVEAGTVRLVGASGESIFREANLLVSDQNEYKKMKLAKNPYGDGYASERILKVLREIILAQ